MVKLWSRYRRFIRLTLTYAALAYVGCLVAAWAVGVDLSGSGTGMRTGINPADATRNFLQVLGGVLRQILPLALQLGFAFFFIAVQFIGLFWILGRGTTYTLYPGQYGGITFDDVRGQSHIVGATREVMRLFQGYRDFKKVGGYPPHGILFEGPPGTGKTLLAKAVAGETGVPFMFGSGSGFQSMFFGVGIIKVSRMFAKARRLADKYGGCVIFIDELDAVGASRGGVSGDGRGGGALGGVFGGGGGTVNELLTQMDGIERTNRFGGRVRRMLGLRAAKPKVYNILVIGATNRAATLDIALLRPGRFDRKVHIGNPGEAGRKDIIAYYLNKVVHEPIDIDRVARATAGYSPARIKNIINEALIFALQDGRSALTYDDIWKAKLTDEIGLAEPVEYSEKDKAATAIHEAGHAIAGNFLRPWQPVQIVTVRKRGGTLGLVHTQEDEESYGRTKSQFLADIKVSLAGLVAEEIWLGESGTGPSTDLQAATGAAFAMITQLGMGSQLASLGLLQGGDSMDAALRNDGIRKEIDDVLQQCKEEVRELLEEKRVAMEAVRDALVARDELTGDEFRMLLWEIGATSERPKVLTQLPVHDLVGNGSNSNGLSQRPAARVAVGDRSVAPGHVADDERDG